MRFILLFFTASMLFSCVGSSQTKTVPNSQVSSEKEIIPENIDIDMFDNLRSTGDYIVIDVRTPEEFEAGHVPGASVVDVKSPDFSQKIGELDKDKEYLVYCRSGNRSAKALKIMQDAGFTNAHNVEGGYLAWSAKHKNE